MQKTQSLFGCRSCLPKNSFWHSDYNYTTVAFLRNLRDRQKGQFNSCFVLHHCSHAEERICGGIERVSLCGNAYVDYIMHIRQTNQWPSIPWPQIIYQQISWEQRQNPSEDDRSKCTRMDQHSSSSCPEGTDPSPANSSVSCLVPRRRFAFRHFINIGKCCEYGINH